MTRPRALIVQPSLQPPGGGNGVAAWFCEALKSTCNLSVLTWDVPDLDAVNRFFGTTLTSQDFHLHRAPAIARSVFRRVPTPLALVRDTYLMRRARRLAPQFDVVISVNNEADLGTRGIQYIHYPRFDPVRPEVDLRWYHRWPRLLAAYRRGAARLTGFSRARMQRNLTLVNSDWIGRRMHALYGIETTTLHPPVTAPATMVPWDERENGFVCSGRISPEKRVERIIEILTLVRQRGHDVHLHVIGTDDDADYTALIRRRVRDHSTWISLAENLARPDLMRLLSTHRYGVHAMEEEHFGMAVAEMVRAGCIVFVPRGGGQVEIVGDEQRLLYDSDADAVRKIAATLGDPQRQQSLRTHLAGRGERFSAEHFIDRVRSIVAEVAA